MALIVNVCNNSFSKVVDSRGNFIGYVLPDGQIFGTNIVIYRNKLVVNEVKAKEVDVIVNTYGEVQCPTCNRYHVTKAPNTIVCKCSTVLIAKYGCPDCGNKMIHIRGSKIHVCVSCGLSKTSTQ